VTVNNPDCLRPRPPTSFPWWRCPPARQAHEYLLLTEADVPPFKSAETGCELREQHPKLANPKRQQTILSKVTFIRGPVMPPQPITPIAKPMPALPSVVSNAAQLQVRQMTLLQALKNANVPDAQANQVVQQQSQQETVYCYVHSISTSGAVTTVFLDQVSNMYSTRPMGLFGATFPPNDLHYLPELVRAANFNFLMNNIFDSSNGKLLNVEVYPWTFDYMHENFGSLNT
jgi:hypothetical protein